MIFDKKNYKKKLYIYLFLLLLVLVSIILFNNYLDKYPDITEATNIDINNYIIKKGFIIIKNVKYVVDYGIFKVKEDRNSTLNDFILLPFVKIYSNSDDKKNPVFVLNNVSDNSIFNYKNSSFLLKQHDLIYVGYRGFVGNKKIRFITSLLTLYQLDSEVSNKYLIKLGKAYEKDFHRLSKKIGNIKNYSLDTIIEDIEQLKKMLGYGRIYLFSTGNGTCIADIYSKKYPDSIGKNIMIGYSFSTNFIRSKDIDMLFEYLIVKQKESNKKEYIRINQKNIFSKVLYQLPKKWLFIPINKAKVEIATLLLLENKKNIQRLMQVYISALKEDYSGIALLSIVYSFLPMYHEISDYYIKQIYIDTMYTKLNSLSTILSRAIYFSQKKESEGTYNNMLDQISSVETLLLAGNLDAALFSDENKIYKGKKNNYTLKILNELCSNDIASSKDSGWELIILNYFASSEISNVLPYEPMKEYCLINYSYVMKISLLLLIIIIIYPIFKYCKKNVSKYYKKRKILKEYVSISKL